MTSNIWFIFNFCLWSAIFAGAFDGRWRYNKCLNAKDTGRSCHRYERLLIAHLKQLERVCTKPSQSGIAKQQPEVKVNQAFKVNLRVLLRKIWEGFWDVINPCTCRLSSFLLSFFCWFLPPALAITSGSQSLTSPCNSGCGCPDFALTGYVSAEARKSNLLKQAMLGNLTVALFWPCL